MVDISTTINALLDYRLNHMLENSGNVITGPYGLKIYAYFGFLRSSIVDSRGTGCKNVCFLEHSVVKNVFIVFLRCLFWWVKFKKALRINAQETRNREKNENEKQAHKMSNLRNTYFTQNSSLRDCWCQSSVFLSRWSFRGRWIPLRQLKQCEKLSSNPRSSQATQETRANKNENCISVKRRQMKIGEEIGRQEVVKLYTCQSIVRYILLQTNKKIS